MQIWCDSKKLDIIFNWVLGNFLGGENPVLYRTLANEVVERALNRMDINQSVVVYKSKLISCKESL